jgi:hypothetical protein
MLGQTLAEHQSSSQNPSFESGNAQIQCRRRFFSGELVNIAQKNRNTVFLRKAEDCLANKLIPLRGGQRPFRILGPFLDLPGAKSLTALFLVEKLRRLTLPQNIGTGMDRNAGKPSRKLRASLEPADIFKRFQEHFLCCIAGIFGVAQKPSQGPKYPPRMPANQLLKSVNIPALNSAHKRGIRIFENSNFAGKTGIARKTTQIFWAKDPPWREIGYSPDPSLCSIQ